MNEKPDKLTLKKEMKKEIGCRMKAFRKQLRFTQHDMSPHCGIGRADLSRIEKGEVFPGIFLMIELSKNFNLSLTWLLLNEGEMFIPDEEIIKKKNRFMVRGAELQTLFIYLEKFPLLKHRVLALFYEMKDEFKDQPPEPGELLLEDFPPSESPLKN